MTRRMAVVIAVDGLRASALGGYGNTIQATPALDELASQSVVVDWLYCTSPELSAFYDDVWGRPSLARALATGGNGATLITDDPDVAAWGDAAGFSEVLLIESPPSPAAAAVEETSLARLLAIAAELIAESVSNEQGRGEEASSTALYWIHARGLKGPWDAPIALRAAQLDEGDPPPPTFTAPPVLERPSDDDALLAFQVAYWAQVAVLDECVGGLLAALSELPAVNDALVALVGTSGFSLGEHGVVGAEDRRLYSERLHVPCLLRSPLATAPPPRWSSLATPGDFHATLADWFDQGDEDGDASLLAIDRRVRDHHIAVGSEGERALRSAQWMLRIAPNLSGTPGDAPESSASESVELYVKPDDRWEANEVAARCPDDVEQLTAMLKSSPSA